MSAVLHARACQGKEGVRTECPAGLLPKSMLLKLSISVSSSSSWPQIRECSRERLGQLVKMAAKECNSNKNLLKRSKYPVISW